MISQASDQHDLRYGARSASRALRRPRCSQPSAAASHARQPRAAGAAGAPDGDGGARRCAPPRADCAPRADSRRLDAAAPDGDAAVPPPPPPPLLLRRARLRAELARPPPSSLWPAIKPSQLMFAPMSSSSSASPPPPPSPSSVRSRSLLLSS